MSNFYAMIMAGGGGTRLWPLSRRNRPKQMLPLVEEKSMFKMSVDRLTPLFPPENIYVVTSEKYAKELKEDAPLVPMENFIIEPYGKDSGPAAALGITVIQRRNPNATIAILTADHHIAHAEKFHNVLRASQQITQDTDTIVTLGITPSHPSTAFGYIQRGRKLGIAGGFSYFASLGFTEKPDVERAQEFIFSGDYSWNSGMFVWKASHALEEFRIHQPAMYPLLMRLSEKVDTPQFEATLAEVWEAIPKISLDYAVMEHAKNMVVIPIDIGWSDVGSWGTLFEILRSDDNGNITLGEESKHIMIDSGGALILSKRLVAMIGVKDLVVVDTDDALLICHRDRTQEVKTIVNRLKDLSQDDYL